MTTYDTVSQEVAASYLIARLTADERDALWLLDGREDGMWAVQNMSADMQRTLRRLAHRGLCHLTTLRNEQGRRAAQFERDATVIEALDAWDVRQAQREAEAEELPTVAPVLIFTRSPIGERQEKNILAIGERVMRVSGDAHGWGGSGIGVIERIIPGHMNQYPARWVDAKAVVAWPAPCRIGGSGVSRTTVALKALARPDEMGACERCGRYRRLLTAGSSSRVCGTCLSREERRINTHELWGRGRRGY